MLADPFAGNLIVASGGAVTRNQVLMNVSPTGSVRKASTNAGEQRYMKISHTTTGKGAALRDRHLFRLESFAVESTVENPAKPVLLYAVADIPRVGITDAQIADLWSVFCGCMIGGSNNTAYAATRTTFFTRWLNGEV